MASGAKPASSSRSTRLTRTVVLPVPALAETQAEAPGSDARAWLLSGSGGSGRSRSSRLLLGFLCQPFLDAGEMLVGVVS